MLPVVHIFNSRIMIYLEKLIGTKPVKTMCSKVISSPCKIKWFLLIIAGSPLGLDLGIKRVGAGWIFPQKGKRVVYHCCLSLFL